MSLKDRNQNFWQLACISGTAHGLPSMVIGGLLAHQLGTTAAIISIFVGNFILWVMGLGIISMAGRRDHAIENIKGYLGKFTGVFAALIWVFAFLMWYSLQIKSVSDAISVHYRTSNAWIVGACLGLIIAIIGSGGIRIIKRLCVWGFPLMVLYIFIAIWNSSNFPQFDDSWNLSIPGILTIVIMWLPGTVNMPTFFRHSRSRADSVLGLSLLTVFHIFFQASTILLNIDDPAMYLSAQTYVGTIFAFGFIFISYGLSNLLNIYYASAGWETIMSFGKRPIEYFFVGFMGTITYISFQVMPTIANSFFSIEFVELMLTNFIASLGVVLLIAFLIRLIVRHRPNPHEKIWSSISWGIGSAYSLIFQLQNPITDPTQSLIRGVAVTSLSFLIILFLEESYWSLIHLKDRQKEINQ